MIVLHASSDELLAVNLNLKTLLIAPGLDHCFALVQLLSVLHLSLLNLFSELLLKLGDLLNVALLLSKRDPQVESLL